MDECLVSIITVCFNAEKTISETIESVLEQTYSNIEYIIKDGGSSDKTNNIIKSYEPLFKKKGIKFVHISEIDSGIFNAMNIAITYASGSWINFMNADDKFFDENVIRDIFSNLRYNDESILYGHTSIILNKGYRIIKTHDHSLLRSGMSLCHQSSFVRTNLMRQYGYDEKFRIGADYDFFLKSYLSGKKYLQINLIVSEYSSLGVSGKQLEKAYIDKTNIQKQYNLYKISKHQYVLKKLKLKIRKIVVRLCPGLLDYFYCLSIIKNNKC